MNDDDLTLNAEDSIIDISQYGNSNTMAASSLTDTITIAGSSMSNIGTITLPSYSTTLGTGTSSYTFNSTGYISTTNGSYSPAVDISDKGIDLKGNSDIKIGNRSLKDFMQTMEERLAILVPDPEKLEKFEALKKAYDHYKTMEALCFPKDKEEGSK